MYTKYFGFNEKPFTLTPNPRFIYLSKHHKEAFAHLLYGINNHYGFIELIGEVGAGKTTVLRTLLGQLNEESYRSALIFNPCLTGVELLRSINHEFGLNSSSEYANELLGELNTFLVQENTRGITVVLVIDEAQNLSPEILEQLRLISNLETENDKLIQIILAGQLELSALLELPQLRQLNQRIAVRYRLRTMSNDETCAYIRHRMVIAGETGGVSFSQSAYTLIHLYSHGLPRLINNLCDRALLIAYGDEQRRVTASITIRAIRELLNATQARRLALVCVGVTAIVVCLALALNITGGMASKQISKSADTSPPEYASTAKLPAASPVVTDHPFLQLQQEILLHNQNDFQLRTFNAIAEKWGALPIKTFSGDFTVPDVYSRFAANRNLRVTAFTGTLTDVIRFNIPFMALTKVPGRTGRYCLAVTSVRQNTAMVSPPLFGSSTLSINDLGSIAAGTFYLVWQNPDHIPYRIKMGDKRFEVRALQALLRQAGTYRDAIDGIYSNITAKAVTDFQSSARIPRDEMVGELTLAALARYSTNPKAPSISSTEGSP